MCDSMFSKLCDETMITKNVNQNTMLVKLLTFIHTFFSILSKIIYNFNRTNLRILKTHLTNCHDDDEDHRAKGRYCMVDEKLASGRAYLSREKNVNKYKIHKNKNKNVLNFRV